MSKPFVVEGRLYEPHEHAWARNRPLEHRPPAPTVGMKVLYRPNSFRDDEILPAEILDVYDQDREDPNIFHPDYAADPWPEVLLGYEVNKTPRLVRTREGRLQGSAGWLPLDWQKWPRPTKENR